MSYDEFSGFIHRNPDISNDEANQILTMWQQLNPKVEDDSDFELDIYSTPTRLRTLTYSMFAPQVQSYPTRARGTGMFRKRIVSPVYINPLTVSTVGTLVTLVPTVLTSKSKYGCLCIGSGTGYITVADHAKIDMNTIDFGVAFFYRGNGAGTYGILCKRDIASTTNAGIEIWISGGNVVNVRISDGTNTSLLSATCTGLDDNNWHSIIVNIPASGNLEVFLDGVSKGTQARGSVASVTNARTAYILCRDNAGTPQDKFTGNIALFEWKQNEIFSAGNITDYGNGVIDHSTSMNIDCVFIPFNGDTKHNPDATFGCFTMGSFYD